MIDPLNKDEFMAQMNKSESGISYSGKAVDRFYEWMYSEQSGKVQVCAFPVPTENKSKSEMGEGKWKHCDSIDQFREFCKMHSDLWRYHVYSGVNTLDKTPNYGRGSIEHIEDVSRLSFDIETERDSYQGASKEEVWWTYRYALAEAKYILDKYGVLPFMVMSENGIHMHYRVDFRSKDELLDGGQHIYSKYITREAMNNQYVDQIKQRVPENITIDQDDVSGPSRVMKVPGTKGIKSDKGRLCGIIHQPSLNKAGVIRGEDLDITKEDVESLEPVKTSTSGGNNIHKKLEASSEDLQNGINDKVSRLVKNDEIFRKYWEGEIETYESRSEAEFAFVIKMLNHGFTRSQISDVMWASGMSKWDEESQHYRERTVNNAVDYFDGTVVKDSRDGTFSFS